MKKKGERHLLPVHKRKAIYNHTNFEQSCRSTINTIPGWHIRSMDEHGTGNNINNNQKKEGNNFGAQHVQEFMYVMTTKDNMMLGDRYSDYSSKWLASEQYCVHIELLYSLVL